MSQYGQIYRLQFDTSPVDRSDNGIAIAAKTVTVNIYNTLNLIDDADDPEIIALEPAGNPLSIEVIDNDEDKFTPIRAKQAIIQFVSDQTLAKDISAFVDSSDNQWLVKIFADSDIIFIGFLMLSDMQQPFLPDPQIIQLIASDHLGILRDIAWTDDDGANPIGKYTLGECIAFALKKTGLELEILVINNLRHGSGQLVNPVLFSGSGNYFVTSGLLTDFFYPGQAINISGSVNNNGSKVVESVDNSLLITKVTLTTPITVGEFADPATITDETSSGHFYSSISLDARTFEKDINSSIDCYSVLQRILGEDCVLFQQNGKWMIVRVDEYTGSDLYPATFDKDGAFVQYETPISTTFPIGIVNDICHADASTIWRAARPHKLITEIFRYRNWQEIICNLSFERGDYIEDLPDEIIDGITYQVKKYAVDCWTLGRNLGQPVTVSAYIKRLFYFGTEKQRYIVITPKSNEATPWDYLYSEAIYVSNGDKLNVNLSFKYDNDFSNGSANLIYLLRMWLEADDGTLYEYWNNTSLDPEDYDWVLVASLGERYVPYRFSSNDIDVSNWQSQSVDVKPLPKKGKLYIALNQGNQEHSDTNQNINYQPLSIEFIPLINGSYSKVTGHHNQVTRDPDAGYNASREKEVYIGDSPRHTFKGAMFFLSDSVYRLSQWFFDASLFGNGYPPDTSSLHPYGYIQAYSVWNQFRNSVRIFDAVLYGLLDSSDVWPDLWQKYVLTDVNQGSINRYFMLISLKQNWRTCKWSGVIIEVFRTDIPKSTTDTFEFKYLTD